MSEFDKVEKEMEQFGRNLEYAREQLQGICEELGIEMEPEEDEVYEVYILGYDASLIINTQEWLMRVRVHNTDKIWTELHFNGYKNSGPFTYDKSFMYSDVIKELKWVNRVRNEVK